MELRQCPFCNNGALEIQDVFSEDAPSDKIAKQVFCMSCHASGPAYSRIGWLESSQEAVDGWNVHLNNVIKTATPEELMQNEYVKELVEAIKLYADENSWNDRWAEEGDEDSGGDIYDVINRADVDLRDSIDEDGKPASYYTNGGKRAREALKKFNYENEK